MKSIDWAKLRPLNGSQNAGFEELCCQLAAYEVPAGSDFIRKGAPDAGVECFAVLPDGSEWGWQAKFFDKVGKSQWAQIDHSVSVALEKHPQLTKYTICIPLDREDPRIPNQEWFLDTWNAHVAKWEHAAAQLGLIVQFVYWGSHELFERLSREEHRGRFCFWFGTEFFSQLWFRRALEEVVEAVGPRYTPEVDVQLPIAQLFDGLGRTDAFIARFKTQVKTARKAYAWIPLKGDAPETADVKVAFQESAEQLFRSMVELSPSATEPLPWQNIADQIERTMRLARGWREKLNELEQQERNQAKKDESKAPGTSDKSQHRETSYRIYRFMSEIEEIWDFIHSSEARLSNLPALLLTSEAGRGKTHLLCDVAKRRIKSGMPTLLLLGQHFVQGEPWGQIIRLLHLSQETVCDELLGALECAAQASGHKALIMIDALNEGEGKKIWKHHLAGMLQTISRYPWVGIAISVRSSYESVVVPEELVDNKLVRAIHPGFADHEFRAMVTYFNYYGIELPSSPMIIPELQTPLFLKILCRGLVERHLARIPTGLHGITAIFKLFVDSIQFKLSGEDYLDFDPRRAVIWSAIDRIAEAMSKERKDWLFVDEAQHVCEAPAPSSGFRKSLYWYLCDEGILVEDRWRVDGDDWREVVRFAYERFSDHLIVKHLLDRHLGEEASRSAFQPGTPLGMLADNPWRNEGLIEALCVQLPERYGLEYPDVLASATIEDPICRGFIQSLVWRDPKAISSSTNRLMNSCWSESAYGAEILDALLTVASQPDHPYNADFLHNKLIHDEMADRDAWWSILLHDLYRTQSAVDRLLEWAWSPHNKDHIDEESARLSGIALTWFLTTSNRFLRDRATKALVNFFTGRIDVLQRVIEQFVEVDDPYVLQRLFAVAYGCVLRSDRGRDIRAIAQRTYDWVFRDGQPPTDILLRDYARGIVEFAMLHGADLDVIPAKVRPPYQSEWPKIPTEKEIDEYKSTLTTWDSGNTDWARDRIYFSVMVDDFARYVIGTNVGSSSWLSLRLSEPRWRSPREVHVEFVNSITVTEQAAWSHFEATRNELERYGRYLFKGLSTEKLQILVDLGDGYPPEEGEETIFPLFQPVEEQKLQELQEKVHEALQIVHDLLDDRRQHLLEHKILPYLDGRSYQERPHFDLALMQRWILKRVFELGWTTERFGRFDRFVIGFDGREARKAERIGKKYQWIAYYEFLARLADNFQFREKYSNDDPEDQYLGPWQIGIRDIDPTCVLRKTGRGDGWKLHKPSWWFPCEYNLWELHRGNVSWMRGTDDLPDIRALIEVTRPDGSCWLSLNGFYKWEQPTPPELEHYALATRQIWYGLHSYLVHEEDLDELFAWAEQQDFAGHRFSDPDLYEVFLGEYFWSPAYRYFCSPHYRSVGWQGGDSESHFPKPVMPLVDGYHKEDSSFDCSLDQPIRIMLPNQLFVENMGLSWKGVEGSFFDPSGKLVAFDPSTREVGPTVLLVERNAFLDFLAKNHYAVIWFMAGEKDVVGGSTVTSIWNGRANLSGTFRMVRGKLQGGITSRFISNSTA